jgi:uncharacterized protein YjiS (DUF1127 family)
MRTNPLDAGLAGLGVTNRGAAVDAIRRSGRRFMALLRRWRRRCRDRRELARLDERTLKDIGLTRADAEFLINKPFWRD